MRPCCNPALPVLQFYSEEQRKKWILLGNYSCLQRRQLYVKQLAIGSMKYSVKWSRVHRVEEIQMAYLVQCSVGKVSLGFLWFSDIIASSLGGFFHKPIYYFSSCYLFLLTCVLGWRDGLVGQTWPFYPRDPHDEREKTITHNYLIIHALCSMLTGINHVISFVKASVVSQWLN